MSAFLPLVKRICLAVALIAAVALGAVGCSKSKKATDELEKAAAALAKESPPPAPADSASAGTPAYVPPAQEVKQALDEYKAGKMEDAVTRLQALRRVPVLSPEQRMALQDSIAAVMSEVYALAEKGDARAIAAVAQYEKMQTGH